MSLNTQYMMPTAFGPQTGPRADAHGRRFPVPDNRMFTTFGAVLPADPDKLAACLPEHLSLRGRPELIVYFIEIRDIDWLAGRHYNMFVVTIPVSFQASGDRLDGVYMPVLWENKADPIITGREQLGFNKIFADLPAPVTLAGHTRLTASWEGHPFFDGSLRRGQPADAVFRARAMAWLAPGVGIFHTKYVPRTGHWGIADVHQLVCTPSTDFTSHSAQLWEAEIDHWRFHPASWEQMPTQWHIVSALAEMADDRPLAGWIAQSKGAGDFFNQYILHDYLATGRQAATG